MKTTVSSEGCVIGEGNTYIEQEQEKNEVKSQSDFLKANPHDDILEDLHQMRGKQMDKRKFVVKLFRSLPNLVLILTLMLMLSILRLLWCCECV